MENVKFDFLKPTIVFSIIGFFIPGFTVFGLIGTQYLLSLSGIECSISWKIIWSLTAIFAIFLPIIFANYIRNISKEKLKTLKTKLILFNLIEYVCIQSSFGSLFSNSNTLCYESDEQNGLELIFTAWLALPILVILSIMFNKISNSN
ncbi:hypothetical protein [Flavobacterium eburneipallidum]|uniref:hypothetical protein n=1 Tax=Flavobacterium eburneipallidum TaxID=3003263 RepID=UPI0022ABD196|nr:hypothetical protein [Flavobacterium eburneipallidum]